MLKTVQVSSTLFPTHFSSKPILILIHCLKGYTIYVKVRSPCILRYIYGYRFNFFNYLKVLSVFIFMI